MKYTGDNCLQLTDTKPGTDKQMTADPKFLLYDRAFLSVDESCVIKESHSEDTCWKMAKVWHPKWHGSADCVTLIVALAGLCAQCVNEMVGELPNRDIGKS